MHGWTDILSYSHPVGSETIKCICVLCDCRIYIWLFSFSISWKYILLKHCMTPVLSPLASCFFFKSYRCWNAVGEIKKMGTIQVISISKEEFSKLTQRWVKTNILGRLFFVNIKLMHIFCKDIVYIEMAELRFRCLLTFPRTDTYQSDYICVF